jgi:hypothetical protein
MPSGSAVINYMKKNSNLINVFVSNNPAIISVAKSMLEDAGVKYQEKEKSDGKSKTGLNRQTEIHVEMEYFKRAKSLLGDLEEIDFDIY